MASSLRTEKGKRERERGKRRRENETVERSQGFGRREEEKRIHSPLSLLLSSGQNHLLFTSQLCVCVSVHGGVVASPGRNSKVARSIHPFHPGEENSKMRTRTVLAMMLPMLAAAAFAQEGEDLGGLEEDVDIQENQEEEVEGSDRESKQFWPLVHHTTR